MDQNVPILLSKVLDQTCGCPTEPSHQAVVKSFVLCTVVFLFSNLLNKIEKLLPLYSDRLRCIYKPKETTTIQTTFLSFFNLLVESMKNMSGED